jgi:iron complex outermembrane receptor protein
MIILKNIGVDQDLAYNDNFRTSRKDIETVTIHGNHKNNGSLFNEVSKSEIEKNSTDNLGNCYLKFQE